MNIVTVKRGQLLSILKENREKHREIFLKAIDGYRKHAIEHLSSMLQDAKDGKRIRRSLELPVPMDQTPEYDRVIGMLNMSIDDQITLSSNEFACYVQDDWSWKEQFTHSNTRYLE